jgi:putative ABC transport system permease protein
VLAIAVEVTMILTLVGVSYGTLDEAARRARGVGADIVVRPPGASVIAAGSSPMSDGLLPFFLKQPHVTSATGTMVQPLGGFDSLTGIDLAQFDNLSAGGFRFIKGERSMVTTTLLSMSITQGRRISKLEASFS